MTAVCSSRLPGLFVNNESLNEHIVHITISWVLDLRSKDYKLNDIGKFPNRPLV